MSAGLCGRCNELQRVPTDQERGVIMAMPFCEGCSIVTAYMSGNICSFCKRLDAAAGVPSATGDNRRAPLANIANTHPAPNDAETRSLMLQRIQTRATKDLVKNPAVAVPGTRSIYVHAVAMVPSPDGAKQLGVAAQQYIETTSFSSVVQGLADCWNVRWSRRCSEVLTPEYLMLNFHKGISFQRDSELGTLGEFYDIHSRLPQTLRAKSFALPSNMKLPGLYLYLEAYILISEFKEKTGVKVPDFVLSTKDLKKRKKELEDEDSNAPKRVRTEIALRTSLPPLTSSFRPSVFEEVQVAFAKIAVDSDGKVTIALPDINEVQEFETVAISKDLHAQGEAQYVYKGLYKGQLYAFKRFKRLVQLGWFYAQFERRAKEVNVQIESLRVTECLLAFEITPQKTDASVASGYKDIDIVIADVPMTWLMEPFRPGASNKWSGTNQHPSHPDSAVGSTANAFAHFVYATSFGTIAVADIQTSRARIGDTAADVMFDLTTHTTEGKSGVGDHGSSATTFRKEQQCVPRCNKLNLGDLVNPNGEDSEPED
ncbi:hypothetical protein C8R46DRAFT_1186763 [Mycena filopes]|nr:hypothetical protein C8R46DRAFT_1186763 [Mycena filopes]